MSDVEFFEVEVIEDEPQGPSFNKAVAIVAVIVGAAGFVTASISLQHPWIEVTSDGRDLELVTHVNGHGDATSTLVLNDKSGSSTEALPAEVRPSGRAINIVSIVAASLAGIVVLCLIPAIADRVPTQIRSWLAHILLACAITLLVWQISWVLKTVSLSNIMQESLHGTRTLAGEVTWNLQPSIGLYVGIGGTAIAAWAFSFLVGKLGHGGWSRGSEFAGLLAAAIIVGTVVRPWDSNDLWKAIYRSADLEQRILNLRYDVQGNARPAG